MTPSETITTFIRTREGYAEALPNGDCVAYLPTPTDHWTLGFGTTGKDIVEGLHWTRAQAEARFASDLKAFALRVSALIGLGGATQNEFDAMLSLTYNIGIAAFASSSVLTNHKAGHKQTAAWAFGLWDKQRGIDGQLHALRGLTIRRAAEAKIYMGVTP